MGFFQKLCQNVNRRKVLEETFLTTELRRCLGIFDLTLLGVSGMLGAGIYVLTGAVAKDTSGPAVPLSYVLAAIAAFLSAFCYAEFGSRIPATGSSYIFTYVTMGEIWGFLMGWNMILEHGVGASSVAKAWSGYLDSVLGYPIKGYLEENAPMGDGTIVATYPDFLATAIVIVLCILVGCGVSSSNKFNIIFALINMGMVAFIMITGFLLADLKNWTTVRGGFTPFGFAGIVAGASRCFYAFAGFDVVASSCEEAKNPRRDIPFSLAISLVIVTIAYVGVSSVLTLMVPWYDVVPKSAFPDAYGRHDGWQWAQILVTIGALCTMTTAMFSGLFVLPRILYAISKDGLLCPRLSYVTESTQEMESSYCEKYKRMGCFCRRAEGWIFPLFYLIAHVNPLLELVFLQVPIVSVVFSAILSGSMALLFDIETLVQFMSIGTLTAYSFVAACVIILRYAQPGHIFSNDANFDNAPPPLARPDCSEESGVPTRSNFTLDQAGESKNKIAAPQASSSTDIVNGARLSNPSLASETTRLVSRKEFDAKYAQSISNDTSSLLETPHAIEKQKEDLKFPVRDTRLRENSPAASQPGILKPIYRGTVLDKMFGDWKPGDAVLFSLMIVVTSSLAGMMLVSHYWEEVTNGVWWTILLLTMFSLITMTFLFVMCAHQQNDVCFDDKDFRAPFVPFLPYLCISTNLFFMIKLQWLTWIRLIIWVVIGLAIYLCYGYHFSQQNKDRNDSHWIVLLGKKLRNLSIGTGKNGGDDDRELLPQDDE